MTPAALSVLFMPFYLAVLGKEGLGLVATLTLTMLMFGIFASGAGRMLQREIVIAHTRHPANLRAVINRGWVLYSILALTVLLIAMGAYWVFPGLFTLHANSIPRYQIHRCYIILVVMAVLSFFYSYAGVILVALGELPKASLITTGVSLFSAVLSVNLLKRWPSVDVFYGSQAIVTGVGIVVAVCLAARTARLAGRRVQAVAASHNPAPAIPFPTFLRESSGLIATEGLGVAIQQMDRLLISAALPLSAMGSYTLGSTLGRLITLVSSPLNLAVSPSICRLAATERATALGKDYLARLFYIAVTLLSAIILPMWCGAERILQLWLRASMPPDVTDSIWIMRWLLISNGLLAVGTIFYTYNVACGFIKKGFLVNAISLVLVPPIGYWALSRWGVSGAAFCGVIHGSLFLGVSALIANKHLSLGAPSEAIWFKRALLAAVICVIGGVALTSARFGGTLNLVASVVLSGGILSVGWGACFGWDPRKWLKVLDLPYTPQKTC